MATVENVEFKWMDYLPNDRRMYVGWTWKIANTQSFDVKIEYQITLGDGSTIWMDGYSQSVSIDDQSSRVGEESEGKFKAIWTVPDDINLGLTRLMIHPISKTYTSNGSTVNYFNADYYVCAFVMSKVKPNRPTTSEISMSQDESKPSYLIASAVGVTETGGSNSNVTDVEFQLLRFTYDCGTNIYEASKGTDEAQNLNTIIDKGVISSTIKAKLSEFDNARVYFALEAGYYYTIRARYLSGTVCGIWSNIITPMVKSQPMRPSVTKVTYKSTTGKTAYESGQVVEWKFNAINGDENSSSVGYSFQLQFAPDLTRFKWYDSWENLNPTASDTTKASMMKTYQITDCGTTTSMRMEYGTNTGQSPSLRVGNQRVFFRVRTILESSNVTIKSDWSEPFEFIPKTKALAPTMWLEKPYVYYDDPNDILKTVKIYAMHNSECGTRAKSATFISVKDDGEMGFMPGDFIIVKDVTESGYTPIFAYEYNFKDYVNKESYINISAWTEDQYDSISGPKASPVRLYFYKMPQLDLRITNAVKNVYDPDETVTIAQIDNDGVYEILSLPIEFKASIELGQATNVVGYSVSIIANESYIITNSKGKKVTVSAGEEVYNAYYDATSITDGKKNNNLEEQILPQDVVLMNGIIYTLKVSAGISSGSSADASVYFKPALTNAKHELNARYIFDSDTMSLSINAFAGSLPKISDPTGTKPTIDSDVLINLYRMNDDGTMITIAEGVENTDSLYIVDPHPSLNEAAYRAVAIDKKFGTYTYNDVPPYPVKCSDIILQWNETYEPLTNIDSRTNTKQVNTTMLRLKYNIDISESADLDTNLVKYVGRKDPVAYYGTQTGYTASWSTVIPKSDMDTIRLLRKLQVYPGDVYVREPSGTGYWARVKVTFPINHCQPAVNVSLDITRVEGGM